MANESKVGIVLEGKNRAGNAFKELDSQLAGLNKGISGLMKGAGLAAISMGIIEIGKQGIALARVAAQTDEVRVAFCELAETAGTTSAAMLSAMSAAARGTISDSALMLSANRAMLLGVADSTEDMAQMLQIATARGNAMGISTEQAFSDLVTGIGRMSPLILDNLGIVTGGEKVFDDYAASL